MADVGAAVRVPPRLRGLPRQGVEDVADLDAAVDELGAGGLDVVDDQQQPLEALGARRPELNRRRRARGRELDRGPAP
jgi:hypothetical protein